MPNVWFTSDLHLGHPFVAKLRGFDDPNDHDATLEENFRTAIDDDDHVWMLGDLALGAYRDALEWVADMPGVWHLLLGNHDKRHPMHKDYAKHDVDYRSVFATIDTHSMRKINGRKVMLSHFPYSNDMRHQAEYNGSDRFEDWRPKDTGRFLLHGHTHSSEIWREGPRELHVGVDAWGLAPVSLDAITDLIEETRV